MMLVEYDVNDDDLRLSIVLNEQSVLNK